ncbi:hypothetical protein HD806DRAFT_246495 [Xylariaceae sp. AK1471]|nr:hypothetical protein HD806DRAFT_246495 [Xylariaceae sp. AK1471]
MGSTGQTYTTGRHVSVSGRYLAVTLATLPAHLPPLRPCLSRFRIEWWLRPRRSHSTQHAYTTLPTRSTPSSDVSASCPRHADRGTICLLAKLAKRAPLFLASVDQVPCQLSPSETLHGCGGFSLGSVPIPPAGRRVPIDGWRGLSGVDLVTDLFLVHILQGPLRPGPFSPPACDRQSGRRTCRAVSLSSSNPIGFFISVTRLSELFGHPPRTSFPSFYSTQTWT